VGSISGIRAKEDIGETGLKRRQLSPSHATTKWQILRLVVRLMAAADPLNLAKAAS
jgi:hypothetical protein